MMKKYVLYIGANNETKKVDYETLHDVLGQWYKGYSVADTMGVWEGARENSCTATIFSDLLLGEDATDGAVLLIAKELCKKLDQYCILVEINGKGVMVDNPDKN
jgi:hypothetical protein